MHTKQSETGTIFHYNGDYSGEVIILRNGQDVIIPFIDLKSFVADYIRSEKIRDLESNDIDVVLGLKK